MRLRLTDACSNGYAGTTGQWLPGTEKDVEEAEATRLQASYPGWFEPVGAPPVAAQEAPAAAESPAVAGRMTKPGRVRGK